MNSVDAGSTFLFGAMQLLWFESYLADNERVVAVTVCTVVGTSDEDRVQ